MRNTLVPHLGHVMLVAGLLFFGVTLLGISDFDLALALYAISLWHGFLSPSL
jgi:hypothetical protein